jgi:catechol 2,3-dioxygenase-like lactoylglutathione lyase family enzyme
VLRDVFIECLVNDRGFRSFFSLGDFFQRSSLRLRQLDKHPISCLLHFNTLHPREFAPQNKSPSAPTSSRTTSRHALLTETGSSRAYDGFNFSTGSYRQLIAGSWLDSRPHLPCGIPDRLRANTMTDPNFIILYVDNPSASASFYAGLLGKTPVESSPTFALFILESGLKLGLWSRHTVEPAANAAGGGGEIGFPVDSSDAVHNLFADWVKRGLEIIQRPTEMDFGFTFVALDPDGHRLRVFALSEQ